MKQKYSKSIIMDRNKYIKQILLDPNTERQVKDWISGREEINQASVAAASYNTMEIKQFLATLPSREFEMLIKDLNIDIPSSRSTRTLDVGYHSSQQKTRKGLASVVPTELNEGSIEQQTTDHYTEKASLASTLNVTQKIQTLDTQNNTTIKCKASNHEEPKDQEKKKLLVKTEDDQKHILCIEKAFNSTSTMDDQADQTGNNDIERNDTSDTLSHSGLGSESFTVNIGEQCSKKQDGSSSETIEDDQGGNRPVSRNATEHEGGARIPGQNVRVDASIPVDNANSIGSPHLQGYSLFPSEALCDLIRIVERELRCRNQPTRCTSCANLKAQNQKLQKGSRILGQRIEELNWEYCLLNEKIEYLMQSLLQKDLDIEEKCRVIRYFHETMVERKKEISKLKKESEVLQNKSEERRNKDVFEVADKEEKIRSQLLERMKHQREVMEKVQENVFAERQRKQVLEEKLREKDVASQDLLKENISLKEEIKIKDAKLKDLEAQVKLLDEKNQILEAEKKENVSARQDVEEEYACREAVLNERINNEVQLLMQVYANLQVFAESHGLNLSFNFNS